MLLSSMDSFWNKCKSSKLLTDSFWSVFGNGLGNFLLLIGGIVIARFLGKELYGEYGMVKTTMFYIAGLASFGLSYTSTKFIASNLKDNVESIRSIVFSSLKITLLFSCLLCLLLVLFSDSIAQFVNEPRLASPFRYLGFILFFRAISNTTNGLLGGFKKYKEIGINAIISGSVLLFFCTLLTYLFGIIGAFIALLLSQIVLSLFNLYVLKKTIRIYPKSSNSYTKKILDFSFPVALQELSFSLCNWGVMLILTKFSSLSEVGIYTAAAQWNAIVLFIPHLLYNVVISYLSGISNDKKEHEQMMKKMLLVNFLCAVIPFVIVFTFSGIIASIYGNDFNGMQVVLNVLVFSTIFASVSNVYQSDLIARGRNWLLFIFRLFRDVSILLGLYLLLQNHSDKAALTLAIVFVVVYIIYVLLMAIEYNISRKTLMLL